jgi:hypothetical protein
VISNAQYLACLFPAGRGIASSVGTSTSIRPACTGARPGIAISDVDQACNSSSVYGEERMGKPRTGLAASGRWRSCTHHASAHSSFSSPPAKHASGCFYPGVLAVEGLGHAHSRGWSWPSTPSIAHPLITSPSTVSSVLPNSQSH